MSNRYLQPYEIIVDFLAEFHGKDTEVVLHNLDDLEQSIYRIRNGHISGRKVGDPITDLVVKALKIDDKSIQYQTNYAAKTANGKQLKCATFYIRDDEQKIVGALCINSLVDGLIELQQKMDEIIGALIGNKATPSHSDPVDEHLGLSLPEMVDDKIAKILSKLDSSVEQLTPDEKFQIISDLNDDGVFLLKGTVGKIAKTLNIAEPTVYKYLQKLKTA